MRFLAHFKSNFDLKANHEFNLEIKVDLKSTLISNKRLFEHFEDNLDFKGSLNYSQVLNNFTPSSDY